MPSPAEQAMRKRKGDICYGLAAENDQGLTAKGKEFLFQALRWKVGLRDKPPTMNGRRSVVEPIENMLIERAERALAERGGIE